MKPYSGNQKPYIYAVFEDGNDPRVRNALAALTESKTALWWSGKAFSRAEAVRVQKAGAVLLFLTQNLSREERFRSVVTTAIRHEKSILTVYLEDVPLDACLTMQLQTAQALFYRKFASEDAYLQAVKTVPAFNGMKVTKEQKANQKRRGTMAVLVPIAAAVFLFLTVVMPFLIAEAVHAASLKQFGLYGLSEEELLAIRELNIVGDRIVDSRIHAWYGWDDETKVLYDQEDATGEMTRRTDDNGIPHGSITDLSDLRLLPNLEVLRLEGQQITDISPIFELKKIHTLALCCNPIESLEGIEALENLESLDVTSTKIRDLSPLRNCTKLSFFQEDCTDLTSLAGLEGLPNLTSIHVNNTRVVTVPAFERTSDIVFSMNDSRVIGLPASYDFLRNATDFGYLTLQGARLDELMPYLVGKPIRELDINYTKELTSMWQLNGLTFKEQGSLLLAWCRLDSLDGVENLEGLENLSLAHNKHITDLTPLLRCPTLKHVRLCPGLRELAEAQLSDAPFTIIYQDDNEEKCQNED